MTALALIDALGPPDIEPADAPGPLRGVDRRRRARRGARSAARSRPTTPTARLRERFPRFPEAARGAPRRRTARASSTATRVWKFDPLHQTTSPQPYYVAQARAFWTRITCPVLYVEGAESPLRLPADETAARLATLRARRVTMPGCGHHPHLERPAELAALLVEFLAAAQ